MSTKPAKKTGKEAAKHAAELLFVDVDSIDPHPTQPRQEFPAEELERLGASLKEHGMATAILLRPVGHGRYQLVAGERRWRAAQQAGFTQVPAKVQSLDDAQALTLMLVENLERKDLNPIEKARGLSQLCKPIPDGGAGLTHEQVAERFGHKGCWATNLIRLLALPQSWLDRIASGEVPESAARCLLPFKRSPNMLAAIENDMRDHAEFYATREGFERQVALIAEHHKAVTNKRPGPKPAAATATPDDDAGGVTPRSTIATPDDGGHAADVSPETIAAPQPLAGDSWPLHHLLNCIDAIDSLADLDAAQEALNRRREALQTIAAAQAAKPIVKTRRKAG